MFLVLAPIAPSFHKVSVFCYSYQPLCSCYWAGWIICLKITCRKRYLCLLHNSKDLEHGRAVEIIGLFCFIILLHNAAGIFDCRSDLWTR